MSLRDIIAVVIVAVVVIVAALQLQPAPETPEAEIGTALFCERLEADTIRCTES